MEPKGNYGRLQEHLDTKLTQPEKEPKQPKPKDARPGGKTASDAMILKNKEDGNRWKAKERGKKWNQMEGGMKVSRKQDQTYRKTIQNQPLGKKMNGRQNVLDEQIQKKAAWKKFREAKNMRKKGKTKEGGPVGRDLRQGGKVEDGSKGLGEGMGGRLGEGRGRASVTNFLSQGALDRPRALS
ncbi:hypothetical protein OIU78_025011 [Salix suchowensis]|nr:hypothetical protein OIU78_025011 [Salix suchowensis]